MVKTKYARAHVHTHKHTYAHARTHHKKYTVGNFEYSNMYEYIKDANLPLYIEHIYIRAYTPTWYTRSVRRVNSGD